MSQRAKQILKAMFNALLGKVEDPYEDPYEDPSFLGLLYPEIASLRQALAEAVALETVLEKRVKELTKVAGSNSSAVTDLKEELTRQRELTKKIRTSLEKFEDPAQRALLLSTKLMQARNAARVNSIATGNLGANVMWDHPFSELEEDLISARKQLARAISFELELSDSLELIKQSEEPDSPRIASLKEKVELQRAEVAEIRSRVKMLEQLFDGIYGMRQEKEERQPDSQTLDFQMFACIVFLVFIVLLAIWKIYH